MTTHNSTQAACTGEVTLVPGSLRGYRTWHIHDVGGANPQLISTASSARWTAGWNTAECRIPPLLAGINQLAARISRTAGNGEVDEHGPVPDTNCTCGMYGWYLPNGLESGMLRVFGVVEAAGRVTLGESGFRAERARVSAVHLGRHANADTLEAFTKAYPGAVFYGDRKKMLRDFPPDDLTSLGITPKPKPSITASAAAVPVGARAAVYGLLAASLLVIVEAFSTSSVPRGAIGAAMAILLLTDVPPWPREWKRPKTRTDRFNDRTRAFLAVLIATCGWFTFYTNTSVFWTVWSVPATCLYTRVTAVRVKDRWWTRRRRRKS